MGKPSDRNLEYMKEMWGTTSLITDYSTNKKLLREVTTEKYTKATCDEQTDLYAPKEEEDPSWTYGVEPTYIIN